MLRSSALILLLLAVAAAGQTTGTSKAPTKPRKPAKTAPATRVEPTTAIIHTTAGDMKCELFPDKAPKAVDNFIGLVTGKKDWKNPATSAEEHNHPLYDNVIFHRVIPEFMIQGGDPMGTGTGGPGYQFEDELVPELLFDRPGRLAMANSGQNTNGSQFFITEVPRPELNACFADGGCEKPFPPPSNQVPKGWGFSIFGQCDDATVELVKKIAAGPCRRTACNSANSKPDNPVKISHIEILNPPKPSKPASKHSTKKKTAAPKK